MPIVKVWNDNIYPHVETFKGNKLEIPAGGFLEMDYVEAIEFKGQWTPMPPEDCAEKEKAKFYKKIRVEQPKEPVVKDDALLNHATGQRAATKDELAAMLAEVAHLRVVDPEAEKAAKPARSDEIQNLREQVAELKALLESRTTEKKAPKGPKKAAG